MKMELKTFMNLLFKAPAAVTADNISIIQEFLFYYRCAFVLWGLGFF